MYTFPTQYYMGPLRLAQSICLIVTLCLLESRTVISRTVQQTQYCVIGAGPGGLQISYYLQRANRDYVTIDKASHAGSFFARNPRQRRLISINKRYTAGRTNPNFMMRHDWNSLLVDENEKEHVKMSQFSEEYYPHADDLVHMLKSYASTYKLNIHYDTTVRQIKRDPNQGPFRVLAIRNASSDQEPVVMEYECKVVIAAIGFGKILVPPGLKGAEHAEVYTDLNMDAKNYTNQSILILGRGNSAFEILDFVTPEASVVHAASRHPIRLSFFTHYVGDVRAVNSKILDHYQLKSLDAMLEVDANSVDIRKNTSLGKLTIWTKNDGDDEEEGADEEDVEDDAEEQDGTEGPPDTKKQQSQPAGKPKPQAEYKFDDGLFYVPYDRVLLCTGWVPDVKMFSHESVRPSWGVKYPKMNKNYESVNIPDLYFAGALLHAHDWRKSSGGFIHGFRYLTRALHRILESKYHDKAWPSVRLAQNVDTVTQHLFRRINTVDSLYQMFYVLGDVFLPVNAGPRVSRGQKKCDADGSCVFEEPRYADESVVYLEDVVMSRLLDHSAVRRAKQFFTFTLEYAPHFSGEYVLAARIAGVENAHESLFLHPVIRHYVRRKKPHPQRSGVQKHFYVRHTHHVPEDFHTNWDRETYKAPFRTWLGRSLKKERMNPYPTTVIQHDAFDSVKPSTRERKQMLQNVYHVLYEKAELLIEQHMFDAAEDMLKAIIKVHTTMHGYKSAETLSAIMSLQELYAKRKLNERAYLTAKVAKDMAESLYDAKHKVRRRLEEVFDDLEDLLVDSEGNMPQDLVNKVYGNETIHLW